MNKVLALTKDGKMTYCSVPVELRGKGRCNHLAHKLDDETVEQFVERVGANKIDMYKRTKEDFQYIIEKFDHRLEVLDLDEPVMIRAVGGYALLFHGIREGDRGYTIDIDTVTKDYDEEVVNAIHDISEELGLEKDWLNNDMVLDGDDIQTVETMIDAFWLKQDLGLKNVELWVADVETLTNAKLMASDDVKLTGRLQDPLDLIDLIRHQDINSIEEFDDVYPDASIMYKNAYKIVNDYFNKNK